MNVTLDSPSLVWRQSHALEWDVGGSGTDNHPIAFVSRNSEQSELMHEYKYTHIGLVVEAIMQPTNLSVN